jgi:fatty-acyl-CoA synthase
MMDVQLTIPTILRRAESLFGGKEIVSRLPDRSIHRYTYRDLGIRARKLAAALRVLGICQGDRVATLSWNHHQHLEAYFAVPSLGAVVHPLNLRFSAEDLAYIVRHAEDKVIIVDQVLLSLYEKVRSILGDTGSPTVIVIQQAAEAVPNEYLRYEDFLAGGDASQVQPFEGDENTAAFMCYTSGTTGRSKGILYSHRSIVLHTMTCLLGCSGFGIREQDVALPIVPMFHASAWGLPYVCTFAGAGQVFPGPYLDAESLLELCESEKVTFTGGVPTVALGILHKLESDPFLPKLSLRMMVIGGSSAPRSLVKTFNERYGIQVLHTWGMTEISPLGSTAVVTSQLEKASKEEQYDRATKQGLPVPLLEIRGRGESGIIPWDGVTMGELEVRGPFVASSYYREEGSGGKFTADGWLRTGDIVTIGEDGCIEIKDRSKDVIKSGGEWISSIALENTLMGHPSVFEAAVIAIPDSKWMERPFAYVVPKEGKTIKPDELREFLAGKFAKFWIPEGFAVISAIPRTSTGKFFKSALREIYEQDHRHEGR